MLTLTYAVTSKPIASGVDLGAVAADHAALLERAHAPEALRRRQVDAGREVDVGDPAVGLDRFKNLAVDLVETGSHGLKQK